MRVYTESQNERHLEAIPEDHLLGSTNSHHELNHAAKRLLLSAHLNLVRKKLRRGLSVEEREILALLPFTIPNDSQTDDSGSAKDDEGWAQRVADAGAFR
jgi:hypothetical protein